ncbi:MAG: bifunctional 5,10-methylenetetrahydrofolate dehydrogenase/5,10-methenyltetrahydrofolate cyclohydrolase [Patescibacteria group bacterium]|nr:bifunctional 5,10-methylenetetrahydrofolate dehydrogenase/5,10-methenyltetrahydrofolate cyclohydrolase [Patescibacteria group bacterium]
MLIDGRRIAEKINKITAAKVKKILKRGFRPTITVFLVGHRSESEIYVRQKERLAKKLGFGFELKRLPAKVKQNVLIAAILRLQLKKTTSGIIVQLPLPKHLDPYQVLSCLKPETDIDCLSDVSLGRLILANHIVEPPTAGAVLEILKDLRINLAGKKIVVIGSGLLVGKPLVMLLMNERATVTVANKATKDLSVICRQADIIISGAGQKNLIKPNMVKKGAVVIDAGFSFQQGKAFGDADVAGLNKKGARVTPTPGGVGPITVARLMYNAAVCAEKKLKF